MTDRRRWAGPRLGPRFAEVRARLARHRAPDVPADGPEPVAVTVVDDTSSPTPVTEVLGDLLPRPVVVLAAWAVVVLVVAGAASVLQSAIGAISMVVIPVTVAVLFAAFLQPFCHGLRRIGLHRVLAALLAVLIPTVVVVVGVVLAGSEIATGASQLATNAQAGVASVLEWLRTGPFHVSSTQINEALDRAAETLRADTSIWSTGALTAGFAVVDIVAGTLICLISAFFFLLDGKGIWQFCARFVPRSVRPRIHEAGRRGWVSLGAYARAQLVVALADAVGIAAGAYFLGLPLVLPIFVLVLVCSNVPIIGTFIAGLVPTLIAFVSQGPLTALGMLGVVLFVQQVEAHLLQPFLMGRAVDLHPLAVILAVSAATYLYGIPGALFAVPVLAFVTSAARYLTGHDPFPDLGLQPLRRRR